MLAKVEPRHPEVEVDLAEADDNPFAVMALMRIAMRAAKVPAAEISEFFDEAFSQDIDQLLETCQRWVHVTSPVHTRLIEISAAAAGE